jgi:hypothetical protein
MSDFIPAKDADFDVFFKQYVQYVNAKCAGNSPEWAHIPVDRREELDAAYTDWHMAWSKLKAPHSPGDVQAKSEARERDEKILRDFNNQYILYAREVTNAERREIGAHVHDTVRTSVPRPTAQPEADVVYPGRHLLELVDIRRVPGIGEDPRTEYGIRIFWGIIGEPTEADKFRIAAPPVTGNDLPHSTFTHKKKYLFNFDGDSGKTVWFALRYENSKGGRDEGEGPFGPLFSAIIP